jgi:DMSO reductase family type II enzyme chaperone
MTVATACPASASLDWAGLDLYRFFALVFSSPSRERFDTLAQPVLKGALAELWQRLGCAEDFPEFDWFKKYEEYEATYIALFDVGIPEPPVPLFESAHDKTRPAQDIALENTWFYGVLDLKWDSRSAVPDYLITQLEFLAAVRYALENVQDATSRRNLAQLERDFLSRHLLNWVPTAAAKLNSISPRAFGPFMNLLLVFLQSRQGEANNAGLCASPVQARRTGP